MSNKPTEIAEERIDGITPTHLSELAKAKGAYLEAQQAIERGDATPIQELMVKNAPVGEDGTLEAIRQLPPEDRAEFERIDGEDSPEKAK